MLPYVVESNPQLTGDDFKTPSSNWSAKMSHSFIWVCAQKAKRFENITGNNIETLGCYLDGTLRLHRISSWIKKDEQNYFARGILINYERSKRRCTCIKSWCSSGSLSFKSKNRFVLSLGQDQFVSTLRWYSWDHPCICFHFILLPSCRSYCTRHTFT